MRALGPIIASPSIEKSIRSLLSPDRGVIGLYLDEITRQDRPGGVGAIDRVERPKTVRVRERIRNFAEGQLPALVITCPGTVAAFGRSGDGMYRGVWSIGITAVTQSTSDEIGRELAGILCAAATAVVEQNIGTLDDRVTGVMMIAEDTTDTDLDDARSRHACTRELHLAIDDVLWSYGTPPSLELIDPLLGNPASDAGDLKTVETTELITTPVEEIPA